MSHPTRFSAIRKLEEEHFDFLVAVLFDEGFKVSRARVLPRATVIDRTFWQAHVNGWILPIHDDLWKTGKGIDVTSKLRKIQEAPAA